MPRPLIPCRAILLSCVLLCNAGLAAANAQTKVSGIVRDSARGTPLADAVIELKDGPDVRSARSEQDGTFQLWRVTGGIHALTVRRIGYREMVLEVGTADRDTTLSLSLVALAQILDTVRASAHVTGIYGVVGSAANLRPLVDAKVQVIGTERSTQTDSLGKYFVEIQRGGTYVVRVSRVGYVRRLLSITVPQDRSVESVPLLDADEDSTHRDAEKTFRDLDTRVHFGGVDAAFITGAELRKTGRDELLDAVNYMSASARKGLHFGSSTCVFVNGQPRPGWSLDQFPLDQVDAIELYRASGDIPDMLFKLWPRGVVCTPLLRATDGTATSMSVKYAVVWLRR